MTKGIRLPKNPKVGDVVRTKDQLATYEELLDLVAQYPGRAARR